MLVIQPLSDTNSLNSSSLTTSHTIRAVYRYSTIYLEDEHQNGEGEEDGVLLRVDEVVVVDQDVEQLVELDDPGYDEELRGELLLHFPGEGDEHQDGDVEAGPVPEVGEAEESEDHQGDFDVVLIEHELTVLT